MADPITKAELLEQIRAGRAQWEALLAQVPEAGLTQPGVEGDWSLKDVLAHLAFYEWRTVQRLQAVARGETPARHPVVSGMEVDPANAWVYEQNRDRALAEVRADEQQAYTQVLAALEPVSEEDLFTAGRLAWTEGAALWEYIPGNVHDHYEEHTPPLQAWLAAQGA